MFPLLRVLPVGSVFAATLILVLAAPRVRPVLPHAAVPARGVLIDAAEHPEWRQFLLQAAYRRADEVDRLRELPQTPTRMPPVAPPAPKQDVTVLPLPVPPIEAELPSAEPAPVVEADQPEQKLNPATAPVRESVDAPPPRERPQRLAGLPAEAGGAEPDEVTSAIQNPVMATLPMEIGETSSTELPVVLVPQRLPMPRPAPHAVHTKGSQKAHKSPRAAKPKQSAHTAKPKRIAARARKPARAVQPAAPPDIFQSMFSNSAR